MAGIDWTGFVNKMSPQTGRTKPGLTDKFGGMGLSLPQEIAPNTPAAEGYMKTRVAYNNVGPTGLVNASKSNASAIEANRNYWLNKNSASPYYNGPDPATLGPGQNMASRAPTMAPNAGLSNPAPSFSASSPGFQVPQNRQDIMNAVGRSMFRTPSGLPPMDVAGVNPRLQRSDWLRRLLESMSYRK